MTRSRYSASRGRLGSSAFHDDRIDLTGAHQREQPLKPTTVQAFGGLAAIHDNFEQLRTLDPRHCEDLCLLGLQGNSLVRPPLRRDPNVPNCNPILGT